MTFRTQYGIFAENLPIQSECEEIQTRRTLHKDTFHAVIISQLRCLLIMMEVLDMFCKISGETLSEFLHVKKKYDFKNMPIR